MWMKSRKGTSLIEVIIALAILMIITNMLSIVFSFTTKSYGRLKTYNERLNVVEFISKSILHSYCYEELLQIKNSEIRNNTLFLDSEDVNDDIGSLSMVDIVRNYKNNSTGDIEVTFSLDSQQREIEAMIKYNPYGNTVKIYKIIKRTYERQT